MCWSCKCRHLWERRSKTGWAVGSWLHLSCDWTPLILQHRSLLCQCENIISGWSPNGNGSVRPFVPPYLSFFSFIPHVRISITRQGTKYLPCARPTLRTQYSTIICMIWEPGQGMRKYDHWRWEFTSVTHRYSPKRGREISQHEILGKFLLQVRSLI